MFLKKSCLKSVEVLYDIPILVNAGLLKPLGKKLEQSAPRYFARVEIEEKAVDVAWLNKATDAVRGHWRRKNLARRNRH